MDGHKHLAEYMPCDNCPEDSLCKPCEADMEQQPECNCLAGAGADR